MAVLQCLESAIDLALLPALHEYFLVLAGSGLPQVLRQGGVNTLQGGPAKLPGPSSLLRIEDALKELALALPGHYETFVMTGSVLCQA